MSKLIAFYLFTETSREGGITSTRRIELCDIKKFLIKEHNIPHDQIDFALEVTANTPGVPYDLYKPDNYNLYKPNDLSFGWTARLTLKIQYRK